MILFYLLVNLYVVSQVKNHAEAKPCKIVNKMLNKQLLI